MAARGGRGRGGARGGRGGARGGRAPPGIPGWDPETNMLVNDQPLDTYPKTYQPPVAPPLSDLDARSVASLVSFRRAFHDLPLYTHRHMAAEVISSASVTDPPPRLYDQTQVNARFGVKSKATLDPFLAVPMYSHQFVDESRTLPDLKSREFAKHLFPDELWNTLDGKDRPTANSAKVAKLNGRAPVGRRRLEPDDPFSAWDDDPLSGANRGASKRHENETEEQRQKRIREAAEGGGAGGDNEEGDGDVDLDDDEEEMSQEDDDFEDDEDGGDYDAEQYFDDGVDGDMEDEGVGESALDF
ncbi:DNA-directed RNA polymerase III, subunit Rpc31 [Microdochium trichocladiopsis]|uniref:DNA-directed RNA polymerase III subunit n=1 Tax=Microdochium trichocladiopsis TaxID=1682393 RepID=A0A9P8YD72_9PEZI|nr:DNA-directed RNA polymerase III, subunit Rpc31 [Microdochium trichocladiopsis]KAH7035765.1 DNA-directed RNA polymerase III, subunit Rpc31 [Microdochium trichocladiopsis]